MPKHTLLEGLIARCCTGEAHLNFCVLLGQPPTPMIKCSVGSKTFEPACINWDTPCIAEGPQASEHVFLGNDDSNHRQFRTCRTVLWHDRHLIQEMSGENLIHSEVGCGHACYC